MWISGLEIVKRKLGVSLVYDLSATPFFLRGSGYIEGTLFPWTMSDSWTRSNAASSNCRTFPLPTTSPAEIRRSSGICGRKSKRVRALCQKRGAQPETRATIRLRCPRWLLSALDALYGHYEKTFDLWQNEGIGVPPVFIVVCNNTSTSELVYKYISGFNRENEDGLTTLENGRLALFRNFDEFGNRLARPNSILIDSAQLESGGALDKDFREMAADAR
jgi:type III restriction enzyme